MSSDKFPKESFCIMPWVHMATEPNGDAKICCLANKKLQKDSKVFNLGSDDIIEIFNSDQIRKNRKDMLDGVRIPECSQCWKEEDAGGFSQRQTATEQWLKDHPDLIEMMDQAIKNDYRVDSAPMYYDFRFGNLCNLKCRSCGSLNSIQINKEYTELNKQYPNGRMFFHSGEEYNTLNDWYNTDQFKENVYNNIDKIRKIYVTGGEPTLIEENFKIMEKLVELDMAKNVTIMFNTNMTNLKDDFYELIVKFKSVEMCISIEGYGDIQEYLRYPSNWKQIDKNIRKLASLPSHIYIFAVPVIQSVNLEYATDFWKYIEDINNEYGYYRIRLLPIVLDSPTMSDLSILPLDYKLKCLEKINSYVETANFIKDDPYFVGRYNNIKAKCEVDAYNPELLRKFKQFTEILDKNRNQSLQLVNPNLYEILENV